MLKELTDGAMDNLCDEYKQAMIDSDAWSVSSTGRLVWGNIYFDGARCLMLCPTIVQICKDRQLEFKLSIALAAYNELNEYWLSKHNADINTSFRPIVSKLIKADPIIYNKKLIIQVQKLITEAEEAADSIPELKSRLAKLMAEIQPPT